MVYDPGCPAEVDNSNEGMVCRQAVEFVIGVDGVELNYVIIGFHAAKIIKKNIIIYNNRNTGK